MPKVVISEFMDEAAIAAELQGFDTLYDPGLVDRPDALAAALKGADALIVDLEDAVAPDLKAATRPIVTRWLRELDFGGRERWVRMNPIATGLGVADLEATIAGRPEGYVVPKPRHAGDVREIAQALADRRIGGDPVELGRALGRVGLAGLGGGADACEQAVARRTLRLQVVEDLVGLLGLAVARETVGPVELLGSGLGGRALRALPVAPAADAGHEEDGQRDDHTAVAAPDSGDLIPAIVVVDLAEELVVLSHSSPARNASRATSHPSGPRA